MWTNSIFLWFSIQNLGLTLVCNFSCRLLVNHIWYSYLGRGMTCDILKMSGKTPEIKDKLTICVIGTNKAFKQDFNNSVGIGSRSHVLLGEFIITFLTSSAVAGSKQVARDFTVGDWMSGIFWTTLVKFIRIFSILSIKNLENDSESDFISEKAGIDGDCVLWRILFIVFQSVRRLSEASLIQSA